MPPHIASSVAENVECTLTFTLSSKLVQVIEAMQGEGARNGISNSALLLCIGTLMVSVSSSSMLLKGMQRPASTIGLAMTTSKEHGSSRLDSAGFSTIFKLLARPQDVVPAFVRTDLCSMLAEVIVLAFSRLAVGQVRLSSPSSGLGSGANNACTHSVVFHYVQRMLEIMYVGVTLSCFLATVLPPESLSVRARKWSQEASVSTMLGRQASSIVVNMQRVFADTISSAIPDAEGRKLVVLLGLCIIPGSVRSRQKSKKAAGYACGTKETESSMPERVDIRRIESFLLLVSSSSSSSSSGGPETSCGRQGSPRNMHAPTSRFVRDSKLLVARQRIRWYKYANVLAKIWVAGISMAWINTTLSFILPSYSQSSPAYASVQSPMYDPTFMGLFSIVATTSLAILLRALSPLFSGLDYFQGYVEWSVATSANEYIDRMSNGTVDGFLSVASMWTVYYLSGVLLREIARREDRRNVAATDRISTTLDTVQSVSLIMFTNSLVAYCMQVIAPARQQSSSGPSSASSTLGGLATVAVGIIVSKTLVKILTATSEK